MGIIDILKGIAILALILITIELFAQWHAQSIDTPPSQPSPSAFAAGFGANPIVGLWELTDWGLFNDKRLILFTPAGQFFTVEQRQDGTLHPIKGPAGSWQFDYSKDFTYYLFQDDSYGYPAHLADGNKLSVVYVDDNYGDIQGHNMVKMENINYIKLS